MRIYHICLSTLTFWNWSAMLIYGMLYMIYTCTDSAYNRVKEEDSCGWTCPRGWKRWQAYNSMSVPANVRFTEEGGSFRVATAVAAGSNRITRAKCQLIRVPNEPPFSCGGPDPQAQSTEILRICTVLHLF